MIIKQLFLESIGAAEAKDDLPAWRSALRELER
jgi:hypothetical protein